MADEIPYISKEVDDEIERHAQNIGSTVDHAAAELLPKALADEGAEARLIAEIKQEREAMAAAGVRLTEELVNEAKRWGRA